MPRNPYRIGTHDPGGIYMTLSPRPMPQPFGTVGMVRVESTILYGSGLGIRYCDITADQAEALGIALIVAADDARQE